jgi:hypothetical protein
LNKNTVEKIRWRPTKWFGGGRNQAKEKNTKLILLHARSLKDKDYGDAV